MFTPTNNNLTPILLSSWPRAIAHLDADGFFASVEQAINPSLKGKPVVVGAERGSIAAASYEAKALGIKTGLSLFEAKKLCPTLVSLPGDYETYSLFSKRIFAIMRRFTPVVEEYSIDEAFADLTGLRRLFRGSYGEIAQQMKEAVERELGLTVSVGVSLSKGLAKLCSKFNKPSGITIIPGRSISDFLALHTIDKVWGFGPNMTAFLNKRDVYTALDFIKWPLDRVKNELGKIGIEIHQELSGLMVHPVNPVEKNKYVTISKVKTFTPPSSNRDFVYAQMLRNLEGACFKARRYYLGAKKIYGFLRTQQFRDLGFEIPIEVATAATRELVPLLDKIFKQIYKPNTLYRSTGVVLGDLASVDHVQMDLFGKVAEVIRSESLFEAVDVINGRYGKHKVHLADSLPAQKRHEGTRGELPARKRNLLPGETFRRRLGIPLWQVEPV